MSFEITHLKQPDFCNLVLCDPALQGGRSLNYFELNHNNFATHAWYVLKM